MKPSKFHEPNGGPCLWIISTTCSTNSKSITSAFSLWTLTTSSTSPAWRPKTLATPGRSKGTPGKGPCENGESFWRRCEFPERHKSSRGSWSKKSSKKSSSQSVAICFCFAVLLCGFAFKNTCPNLLSLLMVSEISSTVPVCDETCNWEMLFQRHMLFTIHNNLNLTHRCFQSMRLELAGKALHRAPWWGSLSFRECSQCWCLRQKMFTLWRRHVNDFHQKHLYV